MLMLLNESPVIGTYYSIKRVIVVVVVATTLCHKMISVALLLSSSIKTGNTSDWIIPTN